MAGIVKKVIKKVKNDAKVRKQQNAKDVAAKQVKVGSIAGSKASSSDKTRSTSKKDIGKITTRKTPVPRLEGQTKKVTNASMKGDKSASNKTAKKAHQPDFYGEAPLATKMAMKGKKDCTPSELEYEHGCFKPKKMRKLKDVGKGKQYKGRASSE